MHGRGSCRHRSPRWATHQVRTSEHECTRLRRLTPSPTVLVVDTARPGTFTAGLTRSVRGLEGALSYEDRSCEGQSDQVEGQTPQWTATVFHPTMNSQTSHSTSLPR